MSRTKRWRCVYPGCPDEVGVAASGHTAASWEDFDKRVWEKGPIRITLTNLHLTYPEKRALAPGKIAVYRVEVECGGYVDSVEGSNWIELVGRMKRMYSDAPVGSFDG